MEINNKIKSDSSLSNEEKSSLEEAKDEVLAKKLVARLNNSEIQYNLTDENLKLLTAQKDKLNAAQKEIIKNALKEQAGIQNLKNDDGSYKCSKEYDVLLNLELLGETVKCEYWGGNGDHYIEGPISDVTLHEDGSITYKIDCRKTGTNGINGIWTFEQSSDNESCIPKNIENSKCNVELNKNTVYTWNTDKSCWENANPQTPSVKKKTT